MIPKVTKGRGAVKLAVYLAGPGRSNEHELQHVVAASAAMATVEAGTLLDKDKAVAMGLELDRPAKFFAHETTRATERPHIWHVSLSLGKEDGVQTDEFWDSVAHEVLTSMGFEGNDSEEFRWVAVRHGLSSKGNDHIHIAVSMVSESGARWSDKNDYRRAQTACREVEQKHGLRVLAQGVKSKGYARGELESLARRRAYALHLKQCQQDPTMTPWKFLDRVSREQLVAAQLPEVQPRYEMALKVRAATAGARSEAEFVRRARGNGLLVRPRFSRGGVERVEGYSVALRPVHGEKPIWYGGGTLGSDLSLPAMRAGWDPRGEVDAIGEWAAAKRGRKILAPERGQVAGVELTRYFDELSAHLKLVGQTGMHDVTEYAKVAREGAGLFSAWAVAAGQDGDDVAKELREAAFVLSKHAQLSEEPAKAVEAPSYAYADLCTHVAVSRSRRAGAVAVVRAWSTLGSELGRGFEAKGLAVRADRLRTDLSTSLDTVHARYRELNPLRKPQPVAPQSVAATAEAATLTRAAQRAELEQRLRLAGADGAVIKAQLFAHDQQVFGPGVRGGSGVKPSTAKKHEVQEPRHRRGPEQGRGL